MTNLRKTFILLSAAITMGNLERANAAGKEAVPPQESQEKSAGAKQSGEQKRVSKKTKASKRNSEPDFNLGMPSGSAYDVIARGDLA